MSVDWVRCDAKDDCRRTAILGDGASTCERCGCTYCEEHHYCVNGETLDDSLEEGCENCVEN
jgi:hypothetical protein